MNDSLRSPLARPHLSIACLTALLASLAGCSSDGTTPSESTKTGEEEQPLSPGIHIEESEVVFQTEEYVVEPGKESYLCYAATVDEDLVIDSYQHKGASTLHHLAFNRTLAPEPDGASECDVLFRYTWEPMYLAGAGDSRLDFPANTAHRIAKGTQLLTQLHLFNTSDEPVTDSLEVRLHRSTAVDPDAVNVYIFGNFEVQVPPLKKSTLEATCAVKDEVKLISAFPHMHKLATELTFDAGPSEGSMKRVYTRAPYSFDDQRLDPFDLTLKPGDVTHITCHYDNPYDQTIIFGESTMNEMCFLIGFAVRPTIGGCFLGNPPPLQ